MKNQIIDIKNEGYELINSNVPKKIKHAYVVKRSKELNKFLYLFSLLFCFSMKRFDEKVTYEKNSKSEEKSCLPYLIGFGLFYMLFL